MAYRPLVGCCCLLAVAAALAPAPAAAATPATRMLRKINAVRERTGLPVLHRSRRLSRSARRYARWMLRADYFGHLARIHASRHFRWLGEALACHPGGKAKVGATVRAWLRSPPHRALLLSTGFRYLGAGVKGGWLGRKPMTVWVLHFGA